MFSFVSRGTVSSNNVKLKKDVSIDPQGRHVLIIEDLIDTGNTLKWIKVKEKYIHAHVRTVLLVLLQSECLYPVLVRFLFASCFFVFVGTFKFKELC